MNGKKYFDVSISDITYRMSLDDGMHLVHQMDVNPYNLSVHQLRCAQRFESFFLELKRKSNKRCWGVIQPPE